MSYTLPASDLVLVSICQYGVNSGVNRILWGERDLVEMKPFLQVVASIKTEARSVYSMSRTYSERQGSLRNSQMAENGAPHRSVSSSHFLTFRATF